MIDGDDLLRVIQEAEPDDEVWEEAAHQIAHGYRRRPADEFELLIRALAVAKQADTVAALAHHFLEFLLESDFTTFDLVEREITGRNDKLLFALFLCAKYGEARELANAARWDAVLASCEARLAAFRGSGALAGLDETFRVKRYRPVYMGGQTIHAGDRIRYALGKDLGVVVAVFQAREFTPAYPLAEWARYREGILVNLPVMGLMQVKATETDEDIELIARADGRPA